MINTSLTHMDLCLNPLCKWKGASLVALVLGSISVFPILPVTINIIIPESIGWAFLALGIAGFVGDLVLHRD